METLILQTDNDEATKEILDFIKKMKSVKFDSVEKSEEKLNDHDWEVQVDMRAILKLNLCQ